MCLSDPANDGGANNESVVSDDFHFWYIFSYRDVHTVHTVHDPQAVDSVDS